jgi:putative flippase GtrA
VSGHARWKPVLLQLVVFACVGGAFNVVYGLLYVLFREGLSAQPANALALVLSTIAGTLGHRRVTFGVRGWERTVDHQALGLGLLAFSLAVTAGSLWLLEAGVDTPSRTQEVAVLIAANLGTGLVRFAAFRVAMVGRSPGADVEDSPGVSGPRGSRSRLSESNRRPSHYE